MGGSSAHCKVIATEISERRPIIVSRRLSPADLDARRCQDLFVSVDDGGELSPIRSFG